MSSRYWVVGGEYEDTQFQAVMPGTTEERLGPFATYKEAYTVWHARSWATVDTATRRYRLIEERGPEVAKRFWVIGGDYVDTGFQELVPGTQEERYGPFPSYRVAHDDWQKRAWATVDSATRRYRIVEETTV